MKLIFVRHGDPDYSIDSLTEKGWKEAELVSNRIAPMEVSQYYVSPLGRAKDTASFTLQKTGRTAIVCDWLQEFPCRIDRPDDTTKKNIAWDWLPQDWTADPAYLDKDAWCETEIMKAGGVDVVNRHVIEQFDKLLEEWGYVRDGLLYRAEKPNRDTLVFFCHFGLECVLLGHLMNVSPMILWHNACAAPTSVTTVITEERREGIASFRVNSFGDISHLYAAGEEPAFAARFCETYDNMDERHD